MREALGALVPEHLHPDLDKAVKKGKDAFGQLRGVSQLKMDGWGVSVRNESLLSRARLHEDALEFFVKLLNKLASVLRWPVLVASKTVGRAVGLRESVQGFASMAQRWTHVWRHSDLRGVKELVLPVTTDERGQFWYCVTVSVLGGIEPWRMRLACVLLCTTVSVYVRRRWSGLRVT